MSRNLSYERVLKMIISSSVIGALSLAAILTFFAPIVILIVLCVKHTISPRPMWFGVLAFFLSQICIRLPILGALGKQSWFLTFAKQNLTAYIIMLAFTAALFEETARFIGARFCLKPAERRFRDAVAFGLGHGFCECILIAGLTEVSNLFACISLNGGGLSASNAAGVQVVATLAKLSAPMILIAIWERAAAVIFHLAATIFVFRGVREKKAVWYLVALAVHTVSDSVPSLVAGSNMILLEVISTVIAVPFLIIAVKMRPKFQEDHPIAV